MNTSPAHHQSQPGDQKVSPQQQTQKEGTKHKNWAPDMYTGFPLRDTSALEVAVEESEDSAHILRSLWRLQSTPRYVGFFLESCPSGHSYEYKLIGHLSEKDWVLCFFASLLCPTGGGWLRTFFPVCYSPVDLCTQAPLATRTR